MDTTDLEIARLIDRMLRRIHGALHARATEFDTHNVGQAGGLLLLTIADAQPARPHDLATALARDKSQMTRMIQALEQKGLVTRSIDPDDARATRLSLTEDGDEAVCRIRRATAEIISGLLSPLSEADRESLRALLAKV